MSWVDPWVGLGWVTQNGPMDNSALTTTPRRANHCLCAGLLPVWCEELGRLLMLRHEPSAPAPAGKSRAHLLNHAGTAPPPAMTSGVAAVPAAGSVGLGAVFYGGTQPPAFTQFKPRNVDTMSTSPMYSHSAGLMPTEARGNYFPEPPYLRERKT